MQEPTTNLRLVRVPPLGMEAGLTCSVWWMPNAQRSGTIPESGPNKV
jgi:hypothetical protein